MRREYEKSEQFTFFPPSEVEIVRDTIKNAINEVISENWLNGLEITEEKMDSVKAPSMKWSYKFQGSVIGYLYWGSQAKYIEIPKIGDSEKIKIALNNNPPVETWVNPIKAATQATLEVLPKDFSCCHLYMQCSDAKQCVHQDKSFAFGCFYRKQLLHGKIFYGANRNID